MKASPKRTATFDHCISLMSVVAAGAMVLSLWWFQLSGIDTGYHIAYGRHFLDTGRIVTLDPFLDPSIVKPFINGNWGTQVLMALVERAAGSSGLILLRWTLLAIVFGSIGIIVRRMTRQGHWLAWAWMLTALVAYERFTLRPELFGYAIMAVMLAMLTGPSINRRKIVALGALQLAWVNLSYYFLVGLFLTAAMLCGELVHKMVQSANHGREKTQRRSRTRFLAIALAVQAAACLGNPWHLRGALHPLQTLRHLQAQMVVSPEGDQAGAGPWAIIDEICPPFRFLGASANRRTIDAYLVLLLVAIAGVLALAVRRRWGEVLVISLFLVMSMQMRRNIAQFAIVSAPLIVCGFAAIIPQSWSTRRTLRWTVRGLALVTILAAFRWTWSVWDGRFYYDERRVSREPGMGYSKRANLIDAAQWLSSQPVPGPRLFVDLFASSNLLPWLDLRFKTLIDTNTFAYPDQWLRDVIAVAAGKSDHRDFFGRYCVDAVLLHVAPDTEPLVRALHADAAWSLVYVDPHAVIFLRRTPEQMAVVKTHQPTPEDVSIDEWIDQARGLRHHRALSVATMAGVPWALGWYELAARLFEEALRLAPDSTAAWNYLGLCYTKRAAAADRAGDMTAMRSHLQKAIRCFEEVVTLQPDDAAARANLAGAKEVWQSAR